MTVCYVNTYVYIYVYHILICKYLHNIHALGVYPCTKIIQDTNVSEKKTSEITCPQPNGNVSPLVPKALRKKDGITLMTNIYILQRLSRIYIYTL